MKEVIEVLQRNLREHFGEFEKVPISDSFASYRATYLSYVIEFYPLVDGEGVTVALPQVTYRYVWCPTELLRQFLCCLMTALEMKRRFNPHHFALYVDRNKPVIEMLADLKDEVVSVLLYPIRKGKDCKCVIKIPFSPRKFDFTFSQIDEARRFIENINELLVLSQI